MTEVIEMKKTYLFLVIVSILCLSACNSGGTDKFLGTWEKGKAEITIEKEGANYVIKDNIGGLPAVYNKGNLVVDNGINQVTVFLDEGYLNIGGEKYKKIK